MRGRWRQVVSTFLLPNLDRWTLFIAAVLLFFSRLDCPLQEPEEPRYAEIPRQMLEVNHWVVPILHGLPYYDKPPLLYWLVMGCYAVFGVQDWAARLVPSSAGFLCVFVVYYWARHTLNRRAAFAAAGMLCLSGRFVYLSRMLTMNGLLCLWVVAALAAAHVALRGPVLRWRWWLLSGTACGLGLLTKGPVALTLVLVPALAYPVLTPNTARPSVRQWSIYLIAAIGLAAPWYMALLVTDPSFAGYFFWRHNFQRYLAPFDHAKPVWYYVSDVLLGMMPWSLLLPFFLKSLVRPASAKDEAQATSLRFFLLAFVWCFLFFSLAGSKRAGYILPAMPPLALALGCYVDRTLTNWARRPARTTGKQHLGQAPATWLMGGIVTFAVLFAALHWALPSYAGKFSLRGQVQPVADLARGPDIPVVCYPRGWDSVSFYLRRTDVRVYTREQRPEFLAELQVHPRTLTLIKSDHPLDELLHALPASVEFVPSGRSGQIIIGWVRRRSPEFLSRVDMPGPELSLPNRSPPSR
jgi:4-amino-4-deoxy-L-arabinose transferase-like glycosyltransferase